MRPNRARLVVLSLIWVTPGVAQQEPDWRVRNDIPAEVVPLYNGQNSPFPEKVLAPPPVVQNMPAEDELKKSHEAEVIERARKLVASGAALSPDLDSIKIKGYVKGAEGAMVLTSSGWAKQGSVIKVAMNENEEIAEIFEELKGLDAETAKELKSQLDDRKGEAKTGQVRITHITENAVTVEGGGEKRTITIPASAF